MKRFKFSMQKILEYKEDIQNNEANILKEMKMSLQTLMDELQCLVSKYEHYKGIHVTKCKEGLSIKEIVVDKSYLSSLQNKIRIKGVEIRKVELNIETQIAKLTKIKTEKASIERLKEKELEAYKFMEQKENEVFISEFVSNAALKQQ